MRWNILVESEPNTFAPAPTPNDSVWDDGFPADGSGWGDDESNAITVHLQDCQSVDIEQRCFAASWAGI